MILFKKTTRFSCFFYYNLSYLYHFKKGKEGSDLQDTM